jgi:hypothetical protein
LKALRVFYLDIRANSPRGGGSVIGTDIVAKSLPDG